MIGLGQSANICMVRVVFKVWFMRKKISNWFKEKRNVYLELDFYAKSSAQFSLLILFFAALFIPIRLSQGEVIIVIINMILVSLMLLVNKLFLMNKVSLAKNIFVSSFFVMMLVTIATSGAKQVYWLYPGAAMVFFTMAPKTALAATTALVAIISIIISKEVTKVEWLQIVSSVQCTVFVVYIFCSRVENHFNKLDAEAGTDALSGLGNRRSFDRYLSNVDNLSAEGQESSQKAYLAIIDIDHFKIINDTYGHKVGDGVINLRRYDKAYRIGGEEFALIVYVPTAEAVMVSLERLRQKIVSDVYQLQTSSATLKYTASIGVAEFKGDAETWSSSADDAMYRAKRNGRNRIEFCSL